jgi:hypothetical protein
MKLVHKTIDGNVNSLIYRLYTPYEKRRDHGYTLVHQLLKTPLLSL